MHLRLLKFSAFCGTIYKTVMKGIISMNRIRKGASLMLALILIVLSLTAVIPVSAGEIITTTVNIAEANKNQRGSGYNWANRTDTLTLNGLNIQTDSPYGLRLPADCTVILQGQNYIKAAKYGISFSGTVIIKGSGSLTVEAGEIGLYLISQDSTQKNRLINGKYEITAGKYGVYSDASDFSFVGSSMNIHMTDSAAPAIQGRVVNLLGGTFKSDSSVNATHALTVEGVNLDITAQTEALSAKNLTIKDIEITGAEEYTGQTSIKAKSIAKSGRTSLIFGEKVGGWADYVVLAAVAAGVAAGVFGPMLRRKKKKKELYERLAKEGYEVPEKQ